MLCLCCDLYTVDVYLQRMENVVNFVMQNPQEYIWKMQYDVL
jgi:hypothetical protein